MLWKQSSLRVTANRLTYCRQDTRIMIARGTCTIEALAVAVLRVTGRDINKINSILGQGEHMQPQINFKCKTVLKAMVSYV